MCEVVYEEGVLTGSVIEQGTDATVDVRLPSSASLPSGIKLKVLSADEEEALSNY